MVFEYKAMFILKEEPNPLAVVLHCSPCLIGSQCPLPFWDKTAIEAATTTTKLTKKVLWLEESYFKAKVILGIQKATKLKMFHYEAVV